MLRFINRHIESYIDIDGVTKEILRGFILPEEIASLSIYRYWDGYDEVYGPQRNKQSPKRLEHLRQLLLAKQPMLEMVLCTHHTAYNRLQNGDITVQNPVYVIDGQQRFEVAKELMEDDPHQFGKYQFPIQLRMDFSVARQAKLFMDINMKRISMDRVTILLNSQEDCAVISALLKLSTKDKEFILYDRIPWNRGIDNTSMTTQRFISCFGYLHDEISKAPRGLSAAVTRFNLLERTVPLDILYENYKSFWIHVVSWDRGLTEPPHRNKTLVLEGICLAISKMPVCWEGKCLIMHPEVNRAFETSNELWGIIDDHKDSREYLMRAITRYFTERGLIKPMTRRVI